MLVGISFAENENISEGSVLDGSFPVATSSSNETSISYLNGGVDAYLEKTVGPN